MLIFEPLHARAAYCYSAICYGNSVLVSWCHVPVPF